MSDFDYTYKFFLNGIEINPIIGNDFNIEWGKVPDTYYFRRELTSDLKLTDVDYEGVNDADITTKFTFLIQYNNGNSWEDFYKGFFYKTDCKFDHDRKILEVAPTPDDGYKEFNKVLNNEYNIPSLAPTAISVNYKARPVLQIIFIFDLIGEQYGDVIMNISGTANWEETLSKRYSSTELINDYGFEEFISNSSYKFYLRYLTSLNSFNGVITDDRPDNDISSTSINYKKISREVDTTRCIVNPNWFQLEESIYGKVKCAALPNSENYYYSQYDSALPNTLEIPISQRYWFCWSIWYSYSDNVNDYELNNSEVVTIADNYKLADVISLMLSQDSQVIHQETIDFSEFFYSSTNPLDETSLIPIITPKSNVANIFYTDPARKGLLKLKELLTALATTHNVYWHVENINDQKRLKLEHISWYEKGGNYSNNNLSLDLTTTYDGRNQKALDFDQNKFSYNKSDMPQRWEYSWADDVSEVFTGEAINTVGDHVSEGNVISMNTGKLTSDIDMIINRDNISLDGFAFIMAELDGIIYSIPTPEIKLNQADTFKLQNGYLAFRYLHPAFHKYNKSTSTIEVNGEETQAESVTRNKQQEVEFAYKGLPVIDPLKLVRTSLGDGQVDSMTLNLINNKFSITLNHDTE